MAYWELQRQDGSWNRAGINIVPILPNGDALVVVEERGSLRPFVSDIPHVLKLSGGKELDLRRFGEGSTLGFPGGEIKTGEVVKIGGLRELVEETNIPPQRGLLYLHSHLVFPYPSDLAHANHMGVIYLASSDFAPRVANDEGLNILALTPDEIEVNIRNGVFCSMNAGTYMWRWYVHSVAQTHIEYCATGNPPKERPDLIIEEVEITTS